MRPIKYKAKITGTNEWIAGMPNSVYGEGIDSIRDDLGLVEYINIDTICQSIHKKDKNGVEIFEGDYNSDGDCVMWCDYCNGFEFAAIDVPTKDVYIQCHRCDGNFMFNDGFPEFEIVGNIHDSND